MLWRPVDIGNEASSPRLFRQFLAAAAITIFASMSLLAFFVSQQFQTSMMQAAAEEAAILVDVFLGPSVQELATSATLSPANVEKLDAVITTKLGERVKNIKVWLRDGTLVYASDKKLVGQKFPSPHLNAAFGGHVTGSLDDLDDLENQFERQLGKPLIEIYAPFYRTGTREIIAVGEVYNNGALLVAELKSIRWTTAGIVGAITTPMMLVLFLMVWRANAVVTMHRQSLHRHVDEARTLAAQNDQLRQTAEEAKLEVIHSNERLLGQIGQDLHDGPIQLVSILALKLSEQFDDDPKPRTKLATSIKQNVKDLTENILQELRDISTGLVLPQLEGLTAEETLRHAIMQHESMTGTPVARDIGAMPFQPSPTLRICMYRIVQECLNNAYSHANGLGQHVTASVDAQSIVIVVGSANVAGADAGSKSKTRRGLGLPGLRRRVEALQGSFELSLVGDTRVLVKLPLEVPAN